MMLNSSRVIIACLILVVCSAGVLGQGAEPKPKHEVEVRGVYLSPTGETNFNGTTISFANDFDLPNRWGLDMHYSYRSESGKHKITVQYTRSSFESTRTLTRDIDFLFHHYTAGIEITSERKLQAFTGMYAYRWGNDKVRFGPAFWMGVVKPSVHIDTVTNRGGANSAEGSITKFAGLIGYDLDYDPDRRVNIYHNLGWIRFHLERLFQTEAGVRYFPSKHIGVSGGYKFVNYKIVNDDNFIRAREQGPFIGGVVRF